MVLRLSRKQPSARVSPVIDNAADIDADLEMGCFPVALFDTEPCPDQSTHQSNQALQLHLENIVLRHQPHDSERLLTPGTGSTKCVPSARLRRRERRAQTERRPRLKHKHQMLSCGQSIADRLHRTHGTAMKSLDDILPTDWTGQDRSSVLHNCQINSVNAGLCFRLWRDPSDMELKRPRNQHVTTPRNSLLDKQQRAARKRLANRSARKAKPAKASHPGAMTTPQISSATHSPLRCL